MRLMSIQYLSTIVLAFAVAFPFPVRATTDNENDIPGTLLVGSRVVSDVGGPTFDRVWRIEILQPRVLSIRLDPIGTGAELGLYLLADGLTSLHDPFFDSYTVQSSAKPGGSQRIAVAVRPGTYFININGRNPDRPYRFSLNVSLIPDPTPPDASVVLSNGKSLVSDYITTATILARDALSGVDGYRLRIAGSEWSAWTAVEATSRLSVMVPVVLKAESGLQRVDLETRNSVGLVSDTASDSVTVDLVLPTAKSTSPLSSDGIVTTPKPLVSFVFSEPMYPASWLSGGLMVTTADGQSVVGKFTYDASARRGTWAPTSNLSLGSTIVVTGGTPTDLAGNVAEIDPFSFTYLAPTKLVRAAVPSKPFVDVPLKLRVTPDGIPSGSTVWLERYTGFEWVGYLPTTLASSGGRISIAVPESGRYRWRYQSDGLRKEAISSEFSLAVRPRLVLTGQSTSSARTVVRGQAVTITGVANPSSIPVNLTLYSCTSSFSSCTPREVTPLVPWADGSFSLVWTPTKGYWAWGVKSAATAEYAAGNSPLYRFRVP